MHVAYFFLGQLVPETYKARQGIKNTQQPVPETFKEGRGKNYEERNIVAGRSKNFRQIKRIREDGETKKQRNHSLYNRNQNEGQIGRGVADHSFQTIKNEPHKGGAAHKGTHIRRVWTVGRQLAYGSTGSEKAEWGKGKKSFGIQHFITITDTKQTIKNEYQHISTGIKQIKEEN
jgi:hypothetical protein